MSHSLFETHQKTLEAAVEAIHKRDFWSPYPEVPSGRIYGEHAKKEGWAAFEARRNSTFSIGQPAGAGTVGDEKSPFGLELNIRYPSPDLGAMISAASDAAAKWRDAGVAARTGVCLEALDRLNKRSFEIAFAVMQTTGQAFMMAFQAGGPHAQDRGLEAVAYAYEEMTRHPTVATWTKRVSKTDSVTLEKRFRLVPRGVAAVVGCSTFPTWNSYPGLFASLVTGNAVIVKPHPRAVLPLAMTVEIVRDVLSDQGFDPDLVTLAVDTLDKPITGDLVTHPQIGIVDYTGGTEYGNWIEQNAKQAIVFTEKAGVNCVVFDSVSDLKAVTGNLAFSLGLYSGQMCTAPQNIFIPKSGIKSGDAVITFDDAAAAIVKALNWLLGEPARAVEILGAIQNERTLERIESVGTSGAEVLRASESVAHEQFPDACVRTPVVLKTTADRKDLFMREMFGPIAYIIATESTDHSLELTVEAARAHGAISCGLYSTDAGVLDRGVDVLTAAGVPVSCNLTGQVYVNQNAAFSDFHVTGANPAGNATFCDAAFVASRFRLVESRVQV